MTHFEIRCRVDGKPTPLCDRAETLNAARERAAWVLGFENFFERDPGESFAEAMADGIYGI